MTEDPILSANLIKGLKLANKLCNHFIKYDPDEEQAGKFQCELNLVMASYRELHKSLTKTGTQRLITEFISKTSETLAPQDTSSNFVQEITERISLMEQNDDQGSVSIDDSDIAVLCKCRRMYLLSENDSD